MIYSSDISWSGSCQLYNLIARINSSVPLLMCPVIIVMFLGWIMVGVLIQGGSVTSGSILTFFLLKLLGSRISIAQLKLIITYQTSMKY